MSENSTDSVSEWDCIVVGAGVVGSCTAYHLTKSGHRTLVLEQVRYVQYYKSTQLITWRAVWIIIWGRTLFTDGVHISIHMHCTHRCRNGGQGGCSPPHFPGRGGGRRSPPPPHFWARTYLKIPPRSLFFHPHNSTVLTPNQSVRRCFEKFIGVGTGGGGGEPSPPAFLQCVCWGGVPHAGSPFGPVFQCPAI